MVDYGYTSYQDPRLTPPQEVEDEDAERYSYLMRMKQRGPRDDVAPSIEEEQDEQHNGGAACGA